MKRRMRMPLLKRLILMIEAYSLAVVGVVTNNGIGALGHGLTSLF
jgi:hypothetical protein